jgi:hypothetical protein
MFSLRQAFNGFAAAVCGVGAGVAFKANEPGFLVLDSLLAAALVIHGSMRRGPS